MKQFYVDSFNDAMSDIVEKMNDIKDFSIAEKTLEYAYRVLNERYSRMEGESFLTELLLNNFQFDGKDFKDYLPKDFEPDCEGAIIVMLLDDMRQKIEDAKALGYSC